MERGKKTNFILRQFKRKSKRIIQKDLFTEFFYLNRERQVVEFLPNENKGLVIQDFFKQFLAEEFRDFVDLKILNDCEEEIKTWYYDQENLILVLKVNWGFKKQEISLDINIENFFITIIDESEKIIRKIDYVLLNDHMISFLTLQARTLSQIFEKLSDKDLKNKSEKNSSPIQ